MAAAEKLPSDFSRYLKISWSSCLSAGYYFKNLTSHHNWHYETYALLKRKLAHEKLSSITDEDFDSECVEPAKLLREAAGIFSYIASQVQPNFIVDPVTFPFPEIFGETYYVLSDLCIAECQQIIIKKAVLNGSHKAIIMSKLASGVHTSFTKAKETLQKILENKTNSKHFKFNKNILQYIEMNSSLFLALSYKFNAIHLHNEGQPGKSIVYMSEAKKILSTLELKLSAPDPCSDSVELFWKKYEEEKVIVKILLDEFEADNKAIYRERVEGEVEKPEPKHLVSPIPYQPPEGVEVKIQEKSSYWCCIQ